MLKYIKVINENINKKESIIINEKNQDDIKIINSCQKFFKYNDRYKKSLLPTKNYKLKNKDLSDCFNWIYIYFRKYKYNYYIYIIL